MRFGLEAGETASARVPLSPFWWREPGGERKCHDQKVKERERVREREEMPVLPKWIAWLA